MLKKDYYNAVIAKYPNVKLSRAIFKTDLEFSKKTRLDYREYTNQDLTKYLISIHYSDCFYFEELKVDPLDTKVNVSIPKGRKKIKLNLQQAMAYGNLALYLAFDTKDIYSFNSLIIKYLDEWRPYLWEKVRQLLD